MHAKQSDPATEEVVAKSGRPMQQQYTAEQLAIEELRRKQAALQHDQL